MANRTTPDAQNIPKRTEPKKFTDEELDLYDTADGQDTGEPLTAGDQAEARITADSGLDRIVGPEEAGLGGGLDQAEEAQLGITDEEIAEKRRKGRS